jgi:uncharacterized protein (TIGR03437 family)
MQTSNLPRKLKLSMNSAARRAVWKVSLPLLCLALLVCLLGQPLRASRSGFASGIAPAVVQQTLACGQLVNGNIAAAGQQVTYSFNGQAGERKTLTLTASGFPFGATATATVFSPAAVSLGAFDANSQRQLTLAESGTYMIQVRANNLVSTGSFSLGLECLLPTSPVDATLACGALSARAINAAGQVDQLTFAGQANQRVTLTLTASDFPFGATATATLFSPTAVSVVAFDANSQRQLTLTENGTYVIQVRANNLVSTGSYSIGLECLLPTSPVDATLPCGALLSDRPINAASQVDQITFIGQANERNTLTLTASGFPFGATATATVFSPSAVAVVTFDANSQRQLTLTESGTYVIQVRANNLVSTGSYSLGLECLLPTSPVDATLACGGLLARALNAAAQVDQITIAGQANERKTLTLTASGFPFGATATATVFSPAAVVVVTFDANNQQQLTLTGTGAYVIQVRANNLVSTGSYSIGLECLQPTSPVDAMLSCGSLLSERPINAAAQVDQITFTGQANQRVTLTLTASGFPFGATATATVFSPAAVVVTTFDANSQRQLTLTESGTYLIQVRANNLVSTGSYSLGLECLLPTSPVDVTLACGGLVSRPLSAAAQVDQLTFAGQANQRVTLTLTGSDFPFGATATATVFSPAAVALVTFDANSQRQLSLTETGTYVIQVRANNLVSTGAYSLGLECLLPTSPVDATLACGGLLSRSINAAAQVDQFTFSGQAGEKKTLTLTASGFPFGATATATVISPQAATVVTFDANSQRQLNLTESGTYVIQVRANNLVSTGSYSLGLECLAPSITLAPNTLTIASGSSGEMTVTISAVQAADTAVTLSSSNTAVATVPATITIRANAASATFQVTGVAAGSATITATLPTSLGSGSATASVTVPPPICKPNSVLPSGFRPFSQVYYLTGANAGGDRLVAGVMPLAQQQLLNAVPLPDQLNQRFCDPVELAPGLLAIAYVPTANERSGDFNSFAGLLLDPANNYQPFAGGVIPANRLGDPHGWRIVNQVGGPASVNAASYSAVALASESIAAAFGARLATEIQVAASLPLPTTLAGTTVKLRDSVGGQRDAPLFFVSPDQVNFQVPPGTMNGVATATITSGNGSVAIGAVQIVAVAPGLFAANANGREVAAALALRVKADGTQGGFESVARFESALGRFIAVPIDLGPETEQVFLILFGTGIRFRSSLAAVTCRVGETNAEVLYAGEQSGFVGLDQCNVRLPRSLIGRGEVDVVLSVDGKVANTVRVAIK